MKLNNLKAIFLDLDDTLYPYDICNETAKKAVQVYLARALNFPEKTVKKAYMAARLEIHNQIPHYAASHSRLLHIKRTLEKLTGKTQFKLALLANKVSSENYFRKMKVR